MISSLLLIPLYALAERFAGGGAPKLDAALPGRGLVWAALVCVVVGWLVAGPPGALLALVWGVYRSLPWKALGGRLDPRGMADLPGVLARHALVVPFVALIGWQLLGAPLKAALAAILYVIAATVIAFAYGRAIADLEAEESPEGHQNAIAELARGAAYGAMCFAILALGGH
ncbi:hypothetical protein [Phenylobacterium sp.]|uniref:hypothetical protein n=1 Tax=Phenylobacterium sp. TaxID=1871053 RepID=UPI00261791E8|nr:hypothetical protein [Phenylobacterium sp.]